MYETAQKYSEHSYSSKEQIANEIDSYLLEPIWQEVKTYRSFFRYDLKLGEKPYYVTRNPLTINRMLHVEEMLHIYRRDHHRDKVNDGCPYLDESQKEPYQQYLLHLQLHNYIDKEEFYTSFFQQFNIQDVTKLHLQFLLNEEEPFLLRYFTLGLCISRRSRYLITMPFLIMEDRIYMQELYPAAAFPEANETVINGDITYAFLEMLDQLQLILYKNMVLLKNTAKDKFKVLQERDLTECYPALKKEQIRFYVSHRELGHYYTIQNYIQHANVCYETARYSLDQLVDLHWYEKQKIGKKFVYFVV